MDDWLINTAERRGLTDAVFISDHVSASRHLYSDISDCTDIRYIHITPMLLNISIWFRYVYSTKLYKIIHGFIHALFILARVSYLWLNSTVAGMVILIKARCRCHKDHHKGKEEAFALVIREAPLFPNYCMENCEVYLLRLAPSVSLVFGLISLYIERRPALLFYNHGRMEVKHFQTCNFCRGHLIIYDQNRFINIFNNKSCIIKS